MGKCGVSNMEEYGYYAAGGTAFVNGTGFFSDDALAQDPNVGFFDQILQWKYLSVVLGVAIALLAFPLIMSLLRALRRCCCGAPAGGKGGGKGGRQIGSPNGAAPAMVVPIGSGGGGGRTPPSRSPGGGRGPPRSLPRSPLRNSPLPPHLPPMVPGTAPMASEWSCPACTFFNAPHMSMCQICGQHLN